MLHKWRQPISLYITIVICSVGAAVQGWDQTGRFVFVKLLPALRKAKIDLNSSLDLSDKFARIERRQFNLPGLLPHRNLLHSPYLPRRSHQRSSLYRFCIHRMLVFGSSEQLLRTSWNDFRVCKLLPVVSARDSIYSDLGTMFDLPTTPRRWNGCESKHGTDFCGRELPCVY